MSYWWQNPITRLRMIGRTITRVSGEGCQDMNRLVWVGKVVRFERDRMGRQHDHIIIEIIVHDKSYRDARDQTIPELYSYPLVNADIQNVKGVWILYA